MGTEGFERVGGVGWRWVMVCVCVRVCDGMTMIGEGEAEQCWVDGTGARQDGGCS